MDQNTSLGILGAGAWGTALAQLYASAGRRVILWARDTTQAEDIEKERENALYLPGVLLHSDMHITADLEQALAADILLLTAPAQATRALLEALGPTIEHPLILCAKGIERGSGALLPDVAKELCPKAPLAILSGPSFAGEVALGLPAAVTLACADKMVGQGLQIALAASTFRPYVSQDIVGVALGGALKNVVAIACGVVAGQDLGDNARVALMTRGLAEMTRLAIAVGAQGQTLMGLAGMGDLVLTSSSLQSRNFSFGYALGEGQGAGHILESRRAVTEGAAAASAALTLAARYDVEMPIAQAVDALIAERAGVKDTIKTLMERPLKEEGF